MTKNIILFTKYGLLIILGVLIVLLASRIQHTAPPQTGEYYYSGFLRNNYTLLSASLFLISGLFIGYKFNLNPWLAGFALIFIFPLTALYEAVIYRGSHNLIPLEFVVYLLFALPAIGGSYIGKFLAQRMAKRKSQK